MLEKLNPQVSAPRAAMANPWKYWTAAFLTNFVAASGVP